MRLRALVFTLLVPGLVAATSRDDERFRFMDVFELEWASDPQIAPDGDRIVYVRNFMDITSDVRRSNLWIVNADGTDHRPLTTGNRNDSSPRWSPDGARLAYVSSTDGTPQLYVRWMDTGITAQVTHLTSAPSGLAFSPDGSRLAFSMLVPKEPEPFARLPQKPDGAQWAAPPRMIEKLQYRSDGQGYLKDGYYHLFVVPSDGGTPTQLTDGDFNHPGPPAWTPDGRALVFSANRHDDWEYDPLDTELYEVSVDERTITALTDRKGPDASPAVSPDGTRIAFVGFDDHYQGYEVSKLYVLNRDGGEPSVLTAELDRAAGAPRWNADSDGVYFQYDDEGATTVALVPLDGEVQSLSARVGGTSLGRPYSSGSFSVARDGRVALTYSRPDRPADVAVVSEAGASRTLTDLNGDLLGHKELGSVETLWYTSEHDGRRVQGWVVKPPGFDPSRKYPLILEIHGGPFASYGEHFAAEVQLYAAAGYVVLYTNPRGSTSYGREFGNLIHHAYPGNDYDDLMSGVDA
ncbi:MAG: LpqB family beta-propeller domain-containing protein, partial [Acidobacteriota bacterium]|nr:LpqB family beta-propeller domain-containing protein [Acidobacteriota bacterium]